MSVMSKTRASKRATTININRDLLNQATPPNINLSVSLEANLVKIFQTPQQVDWLANNQTAIEAYNMQVDVQGTFADCLRTF